MSGKVKMEVLFGTEPVLLLSPLPGGQGEGARCTLAPNGALSLISGGELLARLEIPDYLRDRLDGRHRITAVEVAGEAPVRQLQLRLSRVPA